MNNRDKPSQDAKTLTIILTRGPYVSEAADMAINTALRARRKGYNVNLFMYLDGAWVGHIKEEKDYNNPGEWLRWAVRKGVNVGACERCSDARDLNADNVNEGIDICGSYRLMEWVKESHKVLTFGG